jgi:hypothetical protein
MVAQRLGENLPFRPFHAAAGARWRQAVVALALFVTGPGAASAATVTPGATPTSTPPALTTQVRGQVLVETEIPGLVYDLSAGPSAGIDGAEVQYYSDGQRVTTTTDAQGAFTANVALADSDYLSLWVSAEGFAPLLQTYRVADVRAAGMIEIGLHPAPPRVDTTLHGLIYDAAIGSGAPIEGATVDYVYHSFESAFPDLPGSVQSGPDGEYQFELPLGPNDYVELTISAAGFATFHTYVTGADLADATPVDFGLAPIGGEVEILPAAMTLECDDTFDVTVRNVSSTGETLVILSVDFYFRYSQGVYGRDFTWDLDQSQFPLLLAPGDAIAFPVTFHAGGEFPSQLTISVTSGARNDDAVAYFGRNDGCHPSCAGDCNRNGAVTIGELMQGVNLVLHDDPPNACIALDADGNSVVSLAELVLAVHHALEGCPADGATPTSLAETPRR